MSSASQTDLLLVAQIRRGEADAWSELIARFEGRLLAFVGSRLRDRALAEDVVQETFLGFLRSLPNFDADQPLESYLFSIAAHKLTDQMRRDGRRPAIPFSATDSSESSRSLPGPARAASSLLRSGERRSLESGALQTALSSVLSHWRQRGDWHKITCLELLVLRGWGNKEAAADLNLSEQQVANIKFDFLAKLRASLQKQGLPAEHFPELSGDQPA